MTGASDLALELSPPCGTLRAARRPASIPICPRLRPGIHGRKEVPMRLENKVALVTGSASGIGKAIATAFHREGAVVGIADLNVAAARATAAEIDPTGARAMGIAMDVTDERQVDAGTDALVATHGRLDILVSNAGIQIVAPLVDFDFAKWKQMLAIHLDGAFLTTRAALRHMYRQGGGSVIYMGSAHSKEASKLKAPYVAAKHGLIGLAKVVAKEGAEHNVRANVICPGFVRTPLVDKQIPEQAAALNMTEQEVIEKVMLKETVDLEFTTLEDVSEAALFFAAFPSNALTGQSLVVSHGWHMQ
jgi:3-hydroxybutyrate dehydrogenase